MKEEAETEEEPKRLKCKKCHVEVNIYMWLSGDFIIAMCPKCLGGVTQDRDGNLTRF